jgi:N-dimethylarginine dimethylaminohydrolase
MEFCCASEVGCLRRVLLKRPEEAFAGRERIEAEWRDLGFLAAPDLGKARDEYAAFVGLLQRAGAEAAFLPMGDGVGLDSIYVRDAAVVTPRGVILCSMGKRQRCGEPTALNRFCESQGAPILGSICGPGTLEGGDVAVLDERTIIVGQGYRTNGEGIRQLRALTEGFADIVVVPLPHWNGPDHLLHLMSIISPVARDLAVVYSRLMPVAFREYLLASGVRLIDVPDEEFPSMGGNVLAIAPGRCLILAGNLRTKALLEKAGVEVMEFSGEEICIKGGGGPTCLTRPLVRDRP